ncbi:MAG: alpha/beta hydrolase [Acidimicrobiales bacterium]
MTVRCAAVPEHLAAIGRSSPDRGARLTMASSRLEDAADAMTLSGLPAETALRELAAAIRCHERTGASLDSWAAAVGVAFERAGASASTAEPRVLTEAGGHTNAIEVFGDLERATHIAIVVPGMGTTVANEAATLVPRARRLFDAARALDGRDDVAVVAWLGYDAPGPLDVLLDDDAAAGGMALSSFVANLPLRDDASVTVVAHSYGSLVAANGLRSGMRVDDVVLVGSPGVQAENVTELAAPDVHVYAERAPFDPVALSEAFGRDPSDPRFGATRLATGTAVGHGEYFDDETLALANLAAVVVQRDDLLVVAPPSPSERTIGVVDDAWASTVEAPVDAAQHAVSHLNYAIDDLERFAPSGPWDEAVELEQAARHAVAEEGQRAIDVVQRAASPDAVGDLFGDAWAVLTTSG